MYLVKPHSNLDKTFTPPPYTHTHTKLLCAWDLYEHVLVQKIHVRFPFSQRLPDYGPSVLTLHTSHTPTLIVICNEYIAEFKVGATLTGLATGGGVALTSHAHPLSAAVYNPHLHQVHFNIIIQK